MRSDYRRYAVYDDVSGMREGDFTTLEEAINSVQEWYEHIKRFKEDYPPDVVMGTTTIYEEVTYSLPLRTYGPGGTLVKDDIT